MPIDEEHLEVLAPRAKRHMLDWMEEHFVLSDKSSRVTGPWNSSITPFWTIVIDWLCDMTTRVIVVYAATQSGKTTIWIGWLGYVIDVDPGPMKMVLPDEKILKKRMKRMRAVFQNSPRVLRHFGGDIRNLNIGEPSELDNMMLTLGWPTSPGTLADDPCRYIGGDELREWQQYIKDDTDPMTKLSNRPRTYWPVSKQFYATSPGNKGDMADTVFEQCQEWIIRIPCVHCSQFHIPDFRYVKLDHDKDDHLLPAKVYEKGGHARYICPECGALWTELERKASVSGLRAAPKGCTVDPAGNIVGEFTESTHKSLRIPAVLIDPMFTTVDQLAAEFAAAMKARKAGNINPYRNFSNNQEAKVWEERERETDITQLRRHIATGDGSYRMREVPAGVQIICNGIDVGADHVWATVKGYGYRNEQWLIWAGRIETGHTGRAKNWDIVEQFVTSEWISRVDESVKFHAVRTAVDCRYQRAERDEESTAVYDFCLRFAPGHVIPVMGYSRQRMRYAPYRAMNVESKALKRFDLKVDGGKEKLWQAHYDQEREPGPGYMHLPVDLPAEILAQLSSESQRPVRGRSGQQMLVWAPKTDGRPNHTWDGNVYADFAAELSGVFHLHDVDVVEHVKQQRKAAEQGKEQSERSGFLSDLPKVTP
jgi:phage terminase large subunit GpA-like protein